MGRFKSPIIAAIVSAGLTASVVGGVAIAQSSNEIIACVAENSGNVRIVGSANDCKPNENDINWNQQGPAGPQGLQGEQGPPGPSGATNVVVRVSETVTIPAFGTVFALASCNDGERATGGGATNFNQAGVHLKQSFPNPLFAGATPTGWRASYQNTTSQAGQANAYAICAAP